MGSLVALLKYDRSPDALQRAIELCKGFTSLKKDARVLIKPNLVTWDSEVTIPPYGVFTTTRIVEDLIILLQKFGCTKISVGEGSVAMHSGSATKQAFEGLGYTRLAKQYNISLIDFNDSAEIVVKNPDGLPMKIAKEAVECDFLINVPVLKTHSQTKVSLGIKNLKGCLKVPTKKLCHHPQYGLNHTFQFLPDMIKPALTIVDGIYALEQGPLYYGKAIRKNTIIASTDMLGADIIAAKTIGYDAVDIPHLKEYADRKKKSVRIEDYSVVGEDINTQITPLKWDWDWSKANTGPAVFEKLGVQNIALPKYDDTLCSGCSPLSNMLNLYVLSVPKGTPIPKIEVLNGKKMLGRPDYDHTILMGNCIIAANAKNAAIKNAVKVPGCPPEYTDVVAALKKCGMQFDENAYTKYVQKQSEKYSGKPDFVRELFQ